MLLTAGIEHVSVPEAMLRMLVNWKLLAHLQRVKRYALPFLHCATRTAKPMRYCCPASDVLVLEEHRGHDEEDPT